MIYSQMGKAVIVLKREDYFSINCGGKINLHRIYIYLFPSAKTPTLEAPA